MNAREKVLSIISAIDAKEKGSAIDALSIAIDDYTQSFQRGEYRDLTILSEEINQKLDEDGNTLLHLLAKKRQDMLN